MNFPRAIGVCLVSLSFSLVLGAGSVRAQDADDFSGVISQATVDVLAKYLVVSDDEALIARDYSLTFTPRFGEEAVLFLQRPDATDEERAAAIVAIGAGGIMGEQSTLEGFATTGSPIIRQAAVIALGELGGEKSSFLIGLLDDPKMRKVAMVALLRGGSAKGREVVIEAFRDGGADPDLLGLVKFMDEPRDYVKVPAGARLMFQLRFEAARCPALSPAVKARLKRLAGRRWTLDGGLLLRVEDTRSQARNREIARERLVELIRQALVAPRRRIATKPTYSSQRRRVDAKTKRGSIKSLRGRVDENGD